MGEARVALALSCGLMLIACGGREGGGGGGERDAGREPDAGRETDAGGMSGREPAVEWAVRFGGAGAERGGHVAVAVDDGVIFSGAFEETVVWGPDTLSTTTLGTFVARANPDGSPAWARMLTEGSDGGFQYANNRPRVAEGGAATYVAYPDASGVLHVEQTHHDGTAGWRWSLDPANDPFVFGVGGPYGGAYVYVLSNASGTLALGKTPVEVGTPSLLVALDGSTGSYLWHRALDVEASSLSVDLVSGDVWIAGTARSVDLGGGLLVPAERRGFFVARFAGADGRHVASHGWPFTDEGVVGEEEISIDASGPGGLVLAGSGDDGTFDFGSGPITFAGDDLFVARVDAESFGGIASWIEAEANRHAGVAASGSLLVVGAAAGSIDFFGTVHVAGFGEGDGAFVGATDFGGAPRWTAFWGGSGPQSTRDVHGARGTGTVAVLGDFRDTITIGGTELTIPAGSSDEDIFLARLTP